MQFGSILPAAYVVSLKARIQSIRGSPVTLKSCSACGTESVLINARTLRQSVKMTGANVMRLAPISGNGWVDACPQCDAYALAAEHEAPTPFVCGDGVMRSVRDFDASTRSFPPGHLEFCGFRFTQAALEGGITMVFTYDPEEARTSKVEKLGANVRANPDRGLVLEFSKKVCDWGGGGRVWGNLMAGDTNRLADDLLAWFASVEHAGTDDEAIAPGVAIHGLAISFASKHLRMLQPDRFAVLDSVISEGLGFALNPKGYAFFMRSLRTFSEGNSFNGTIATLESGIFSLVRQHVRSR